MIAELMGAIGAASSIGSSLFGSGGETKIQYPPGTMYGVRTLKAQSSPILQGRMTWLDILNMKRMRDTAEKARRSGEESLLRTAGRTGSSGPEVASGLRSINEQVAPMTIGALNDWLMNRYNQAINMASQLARGTNSPVVSQTQPSDASRAMSQVGQIGGGIAGMKLGQPTTPAPSVASAAPSMASTVQPPLTWEQMQEYYRQRNYQRA